MFPSLASLDWHESNSNILRGCKHTRANASRYCNVGMCFILIVIEMEKSKSEINRNMNSDKIRLNTQQGQVHHDIATLDYV